MHRSRPACGQGRRKIRSARLPQAISQVGKIDSGDQPGGCGVQPDELGRASRYPLQLQVLFHLMQSDSEGRRKWDSGGCRHCPNRSHYSLQPFFGQESRSDAGRPPCVRTRQHRPSRPRGCRATTLRTCQSTARGRAKFLAGFRLALALAQGMAQMRLGRGGAQIRSRCPKDPRGLRPPPQRLRRHCRPRGLHKTSGGTPVEALRRPRTPTHCSSSPCRPTSTSASPIPFSESGALTQPSAAQSSMGFWQ